MPGKGQPNTLSPLNPQGTVLVEGELWTARSEGDTIDVGEEVVVVKVQRPRLLVQRKQ